MHDNTQVIPEGIITKKELAQRLKKEAFTKAGKTLDLQAQIVGTFLQGKGKQASNGNGHSQGGGPTPALLRTVGGMAGRFGRRLFIDVIVNGQTQSKIFGNEKQLAEAITDAGFPQLSGNILEQVPLNLPCKVVTKPTADGKYLNIERVLPA